MAAPATDPPRKLPSMSDQQQQNLADVLPSEDPLDATDFDPVAYLNVLFPNERSLPSLEPRIEDAAEQVSQLDLEISKAVHAQAEAGARATKDIATAREAMAELCTRVASIKTKASESENLVREICADIKDLDRAKRNLQRTITALKRLHMLHAASAQLKDAVAQKRYGEAANLLDAIGHLETYFAPFGNVPRVASLSQDVEQVRSRLKQEVFGAFEKASILSENSTIDGFDAYGGLRDCCLVVDALGPAARERQVSAFVARQLQPYRKLFPKGGEDSTLENVDRRFAWIRRVLKKYRETYAVKLPAKWRVEKRLVLAFAARSREMLLDVLSSGENEGVAPVLTALQKALVFEKEAQHSVEDDEAALRREPPSEESEINEDHLTDAQLQRVQEDKRAKEEEDGLARTKILGALSSVFDPFMDGYISLEKQNLEDVLQRTVSEDAVDRDGALPVLASSVHVFAYIKTSVRRCTALTTGQTFFKLHRAFGECLKSYAERLGGLLDVVDAPQQQKSSSRGARVLLDAMKRHQTEQNESDGEDLAINDAEAACYCLNTAEYCAETAGQLAEIVRGKIDDQYRERVDLTQVEDAFHDVVARAVTKVVGALETAIAPALRKAKTAKWGVLDTIDEESVYVGDVVKAIKRVAPAVRALLSPLYFRNFCDKFASAFFAKYYDLIRTQKRINEMGTHQLLLDLHSLKPALLALPTMGDESSPPAPAAYNKFILSESAKVETLLKLVGTPTDALVERFKIMWPDGSEKDLARVCAVKGMKRAEIAFTLETFGADAATARSAAEEQVRSQSPPPAAASSNDLSERLRLGVSSLSTFGRS